MSLLSRYIDKQVKKHGLKSFLIRIMQIVARVTPSKKDDKIVKEIIKVVDKLD